MDEQTILTQIIAGAKKGSAIPEALTLENDNYLFVYVAGAGFRRVKKSNIVFGDKLQPYDPTKIGTAGVVYLDSANSRLYQWVNEAYRQLLTGQAITDALGFSPADNSKVILLTEKGVAQGVATLDSGGKIPSSQLPNLAITDVIVATETSLSGFITNMENYRFEQGDVIIITNTDGSKANYLFKGGDKTQETNYSKITVDKIEISQVIGLQAALDSKLNATAAAITAVLGYTPADRNKLEWVVQDTEWADGFMLHNVANDYSDFVTKLDNLGANPVMGFVHRVDGQRRFLLNISTANGFGNFAKAHIRARKMQGGLLSNDAVFAGSLVYETTVIIDRGYGNENYEVYTMPSHNLSGTTDSEAKFWVKRFNTSIGSRPIKFTGTTTPYVLVDEDKTKHLAAQAQNITVPTTVFKAGDLIAISCDRIGGTTISGIAFGGVNGAFQSEIKIQAVETVFLKFVSNDAAYYYGNRQLVRAGFVENTTILNLNNTSGTVYNYATPSTATSYSTQNPIVNGFARCFINADSEPTVTGATKIAGSAFAANTVMEMIVSSPNGTAVEYYFLAR
jgi:hypothetical protein